MQSLPLSPGHYKVPSKTSKVVFVDSQSGNIVDCSGTWRRGGKVKGYRKSLEKFLAIRNRVDIEKFVIGYGFPTGTTFDNILEQFFYDMAFTLSWVRKLIETLECMKANQNFDALDVKRATTRESVLLKPSVTFAEQFPDGVKLIDKRGERIEWSELRVPKFDTELRDKTRFYIEETLRYCFSGSEGISELPEGNTHWTKVREPLLPLDYKVVLSLKSGNLPEPQLVPNTTLDGMIAAILSQWQETKFKRCEKRGCTNMFEFERSTKRFCSNKCQKAHSRQHQ